MKGIKAAVGDWIRFPRDGGLVISEVRYVEDVRFSHEGERYCTDLGWTCEAGVLEVRSRKEGA